MRRNLIAVVAGLLLAGPALAQNSATILRSEVDVRSGPSMTAFATSKLKQNDRVEIVRISKDPAWLEIRPPAQSFSWIKAKNVRQIDATHAAVECDPTRPVDILPGSRIVDQPPDRISMTLTQGTVVVIVDRPLTVNGETYLPIAPHPSEVRYLPADAVQQSTVVAAQNSPTNWTLSQQGYTANPYLAEGDKALASGDRARAQQYYQQAANTAADQNQKVLAMNKLMDLQRTNTTPAIPASLTKSSTAFSPSNPAVNLQKIAEAAWSKYGRLYDTKQFGENGQPLYALDVGEKVPIYVTTLPGKSLETYIGRTICVYGPTLYRSDMAVRLPFVMASHVAVP